MIFWKERKIIYNFILYWIFEIVALKKNSINFIFEKIIQNMLQFYNKLKVSALYKINLKSLNFNEINIIVFKIFFLNILFIVILQNLLN